MRLLRQLSELLDGLPVAVQFLIAVGLTLFASVSVLGRVFPHLGKRIFTRISDEEIRTNRWHVFRYTVCPVFVCIGFWGVLIMRRVDPGGGGNLVPLRGPAALNAQKNDEDRRQEILKEIQRRKRVLELQRKHEELRRAGTREFVDTLRKDGARPGLKNTPKRDEIETFASGAADLLATPDVVEYRDDPSVALDSKLAPVATNLVAGATIKYYEIEQDESAYSPGNGWLYTLFAGNVVAIDVDEMRPRRMLELPYVAEHLQLCSEGPILECGNRMLVLDWNLRPLRSAPLSTYQRYPNRTCFHGSNLMLLWREGDNAIRSQDIGTLVATFSDGASFTTSAKPGFYPSQLGAGGEAKLVVKTKSANSRYFDTLAAFDGAKSLEEVRTAVTLPVGLRAGLEAEIQYVAEDTYGIRYLDNEAQRAQTLVYSLVARQTPVLSAVIDEETNEDSPHMVKGLFEQMVCMRISRDSLLAWRPGIDTPVIVSISEGTSPTRTIREIVPLAEAVGFWTADGLFGVLEHPDIQPAQILDTQTDEVVIAPTRRPERLEHDLPELVSFERRPPRALQSIQLLEGEQKNGQRSDSGPVRHLLRPVSAAAYDARDHVIVTLQPDFGMVTLNADSLRSIRYAPLPSQATRLTSIGGLPLLRSQVDSSLAMIVGRQLRQLSPFRFQFDTVERHAPFIWTRSDTAIEVSQLDQDAQRWTCSLEAIVKQLRAFGMVVEDDPLAICDLAADDEGDAWLYLVQDGSLIRAKIPTAGAAAEVKLERLGAIPRETNAIRVFPPCLVAFVEGDAHVYSMEPKLRSRQILTGTTLANVAGFGNRFYVLHDSFGKPTISALSNATQYSQSIPVPVDTTDLGNCPLAPFPAGVLVCGKRPVVVEFRNPGFGP